MLLPAVSVGRLCQLHLSGKLYTLIAWPVPLFPVGRLHLALAVNYDAADLGIGVILPFWTCTPYSSTAICGSRYYVLSLSWRGVLDSVSLL